MRETRASDTGIKAVTVVDDNNDKLFGAEGSVNESSKSSETVVPASITDTDSHTGHRLASVSNNVDHKSKSKCFADVM